MGAHEFDVNKIVWQCLKRAMYLVFLPSEKGVCLDIWRHRVELYSLLRPCAHSSHFRVFISIPGDKRQAVLKGLVWKDEHRDGLFGT